MEVIGALMEVGGARIEGSGSLSVQSDEDERTARARMAATQPAGRRGDLGALSNPASVVLKRASRCREIDLRGAHCRSSERSRPERSRANNLQLDHSRQGGCLSVTETEELRPCQSARPSPRREFS